MIARQLALLAALAAILTGCPESGAQHLGLRAHAAPPLAHPQARAPAPRTRRRPRASPAPGAPELIRDVDQLARSVSRPVRTLDGVLSRLHHRLHRDVLVDAPDGLAGPRGQDHAG